MRRRPVDLPLVPEVPPVPKLKRNTKTIFVFCLFRSSSFYYAYTTSGSPSSTQTKTTSLGLCCKRRAITHARIDRLSIWCCATKSTTKTNRIRWLRNSTVERVSSRGLHCASKWSSWRSTECGYCVET